MGSSKSKETRQAQQRVHPTRNESDLISNNSHLNQTQARYPEIFTEISTATRVNAEAQERARANIWNSNQTQARNPSGVINTATRVNVEAQKRASANIQKSNPIQARNLSGGVSTATRVNVEAQERASANIQKSNQTQASNLSGGVSSAARVNNAGTQERASAHTFQSNNLFRWDSDILSDHIWNSNQTQARNPLGAISTATRVNNVEAQDRPSAPTFQPNKFEIELSNFLKSNQSQNMNNPNQSHIEEVMAKTRENNIGIVTPQPHPLSPKKNKPHSSLVRKLTAPSECDAEYSEIDLLKPQLIMPREYIIPLIISFDGKYDAALWIDRLEKLKIIFNWSTDATLKYAIWRLASAAKLWYQANNDSVPTWEIFKAKLTAAFPGVVNEANVLYALQAEKRSPNMDYVAYINKMIEIGQQAGVSHPIIITHIFQGLNCKQLEDDLVKMKFKECRQLMEHIRLRKSADETMKPTVVEFEPNRLIKLSVSSKEIQREIEQLSLNLYRKGSIRDDGFLPCALLYEEFNDELDRRRIRVLKLDQIEHALEMYKLGHKEKDYGNYKFNIEKLKSLSGHSGSQNNLAFSNTNDLPNKLFEIDINGSNSSRKTKELATLKPVLTIKRSLDLNYETKTKSCLICRIDFSNEFEFAQHLDLHGREFKMNIDSLQVAGLFHITEASFQIKHKYDPNAEATVFIIENTCKCRRLISGIHLFHTTNQMIHISRDPFTIGVAEFHQFSIRNSIFGLNNHNYSLFIISNDESFTEYIDHYYFNVNEVAKEEPRTQTVPTRIHKSMKLLKIESLDPPKLIIEFVQRKFNLNAASTVEEKQLYDFIKLLLMKEKDLIINSQNYVEALEIMNHILDYNLQYDLIHYTANAAHIISMPPTSKSDFCYKVPVHNFSCKMTCLAEGDFIKLSFSDSGDKKKTKQGSVHQIQSDFIVFEMGNHCMDTNISYVITFKPNNIVARLENQALRIIKKLKVSEMFFPTEVPPEKELKDYKFDWFNRNMENNSEQMEAITNIVQETAFPVPYMIFGPPGTGKTATIVEAIAQIWKLKPNCSILVTAQSNFACNEIAVRLFKYIPPNQIFRYFSGSAEKIVSDLDETLKARSNLADGHHRIPSWLEIYNNRIVICTLTNCGRLVQARVKSGHFNYVFIDECASATEPAALVSVAGIITSFGKLNGNLILCGDPKQLSAVVQSKFAQKLGLEISMMERMMAMDIYQQDPVTHRYNSRVITKLINNYRSHRAILKFSNDHFYGGELRAMAKDVYMGCSWRSLPNKQFPILFQTAIGETEKEDDSTSLFNKLEVDLAYFFLKKLILYGIKEAKIAQEDIGIISPYQLQVQKLKQMCFRNQWPNIEIGSIEQFQGREKPIIILSTVRSCTFSVGFLNNVKRLNVALTRAKSLLIIIGNPKTLQKDKTWFKFLTYLKQNNALRGPQFELNQSNIIDSIRESVELFL